MGTFLLKTKSKRGNLASRFVEYKTDIPKRPQKKAQELGYLD